MAELAAAYDRLDATQENVLRPCIVEGKGQELSGRKSGLAFSAHLRGKSLDNLFLQLNDEERIDLLALGWLGQGISGAEWQPIFERACSMIDGFASGDWRYVIHLGGHCAGYERLTGISL